MRGLVEARVVSGMVLALGLALLVPLAISLLYRDGSWASFLLPGAAMSLIGGVGLRLTAPPARTPRYVSNRDVYLSVTLAWVVAALLGGVPFLIEGTFDSPLDSTFEAMSGFTTTGSTLLSDIEAQTPSILFWRSMTQWLGGIGIVVLFVAIAPVIGGGAARLLGAEVSGLSQTRLTPRIADTDKALLIIYLAISLAETIALLAVGMPLYDAVVHTFTTVATGGFSPKTASIGFYDSVGVEAVIVFFMVASGVSFSLYYLLYTRRRFDVVLDSFWCEIEERTTLGIGSPIRFGLWSDSSIIEPPTFGLWCRGWSSALPSPPICQTLPRLYPDNDQDVPGAS